MKIAILTIATGKYDIFIDGLVKSCEDKFLPGMDKEYFIFTDSDRIPNTEKVTTIAQKKLGWPFDTMMRFHMFNSIGETLEKFDYVFFMNSNLKIISTVGSFILETTEECGLIVTLHPGFYEHRKIDYPLERNPASSFYFPFGKERYYFQGCLNGGKSDDFMKMSRELAYLIDIDLEKNIIPLWHDESALNWYMMEKTPKILDPTFAYPDLFIGDPDRDPHQRIIRKFGDPKILQLNKDDFGGKIQLRS